MTGRRRGTVQLAALLVAALFLGTAVGAQPDDQWTALAPEVQAAIGVQAWNDLATLAILTDLSIDAQQATTISAVMANLERERVASQAALGPLEAAAQQEAQAATQALLTGSQPPTAPRLWRYEEVRQATQRKWSDTRSTATADLLAMLTPGQAAVLARSDALAAPGAPARTAQQVVAARQPRVKWRAEAFLGLLALAQQAQGERDPRRFGILVQQVALRTACQVTGLLPGSPQAQALAEEFSQRLQQARRLSGDAVGPGLQATAMTMLRAAERTLMSVTQLGPGQTSAPPALVTSADWDGILDNPRGSEIVALFGRQLAADTP